MKEYLEKRNQKAIELREEMVKLRDQEIESGGPNAALFTLVVSELSYRVAHYPDEDGNLCPICGSPIPEADYDHYCGFCGQFINK